MINKIISYLIAHLFNPSETFVAVTDGLEAIKSFTVDEAIKAVAEVAHALGIATKGVHLVKVGVPHKGVMSHRVSACEEAQDYKALFMQSPSAYNKALAIVAKIFDNVESQTEFTGDDDEGYESYCDDYGVEDILKKFPDTVVDGGLILNALAEYGNEHAIEE